MILYNVTVNIDPSIHEEWMLWMKEKHIPDVMNTKMFVDYKMLKVLHNDPEEGLTYCLQYYARNMQDFENYRDNFAPALQEEYKKRFEGKFFAFRTLLEVV